MNTTILIIILIVCWTMNPLIKKICTKKLGTNESVLLNHILYSILLAIYIYYLIRQNKCDINSIRKLKYQEIFIYIIGALLTIISSICLFEVLQHMQLSEIIPIIQPSVILLTLLLGYFIFNESLSLIKIIGTLLVSVGIFLITKK